MGNNSLIIYVNIFIIIIIILKIALKCSRVGDSLDSLSDDSLSQKKKSKPRGDSGDEVHLFMTSLDERHGKTASCLLNMHVANKTVPFVNKHERSLFTNSTTSDRFTQTLKFCIK